MNLKDCTMTQSHMKRSEIDFVNISYFKYENFWITLDWLLQSEDVKMLSRYCNNSSGSAYQKSYLTENILLTRTFFTPDRDHCDDTSRNFHKLM